MAKKIAHMAIFAALAILFGYIEMLIPFHFGVPGVKLGLANLVILLGLYLLGTGETFGILLLRILISAMLFGGVTSFLYSLAGGVLSFAVMCLLKKLHFGMAGVSIGGGVTHNIGQMAVAALLVKNFRVMAYLPVLLLAGLVTGGIIGIIGNLLYRKLKRFAILKEL